jgi:hypothetical protein
MAQGIKPLPMTHDGWIQQTVALVGTGELSEEVEQLIAGHTVLQRNPIHPHEVTVGLLEVSPANEFESRPNPFGDSATLTFSLRREAPVTLEILDVAGRRLRTLAERRYAAGRRTVN